jgi:hypothetical protein
MNYGFEIYVDHDRIRLTEDLLRPLSASSGTTLYGLHYPAPKDIPFWNMGDDYSYAKTSHDLMITTIPFDLWPVCVAGRVDVKHQNGVMERVLLVLKEYGLDILHLRCTRSGHRYATISFVASLVGFGKENEDTMIPNIVRKEILERRVGIRLPNPDSTKEELGSYPNLLKKESETLKNGLVRRLGNPEIIDYLHLHRGIDEGEEQGHFAQSLSEATPLGEEDQRFEDILHWRSAFNRYPVGLWALKNLAYFYAFSVHKKSRHSTVNFKATVADDWSIVFKDPEQLDIRTNLGRDLPTVGFANLDTEAHLMRLAILSPVRLEAFRSVDLDFRFISSSERTLSIGALHDLVGALAINWNIWKIYNRGDLYEPQDNGKPGFALGRISFIMEYDPASESTPPPSNKEIEAELQRAINFEEFSIHNVKIRKFTSRKIFISIKGDNQLERAPEILDLCKEVGAEFGFLRENVRTVETYGVSSLSEEVTRAIEDSSGLIQFLMSNDPQGSFTWIESELFHATVRGLPTVRIVDPRLMGESRFFQDKAPIFLPEFASSSRFKAAIRKAFGDIVTRISDTGVPLGNRRNRS